MKLKLYHTSDREIPVPDLKRGRKNADFGQGFYLSPDLDFIRRWAVKDAVLNCYELDLTGLRVQQFARDADWFRYIFQNRRVQDVMDADVIIGPIANDTIFDTLGILSSSFLATDDALQLLMIGPEYTQVAVKTEAAKANLRWLGAEAMENAEGGTRRQEQDAYLEAFSQKLLEITGEEAE